MNYFESQRGHDLCNLLFKPLRDVNDAIENREQSQVSNPRSKTIPPELQLRLDVQTVMAKAAGDYTSRILSAIEDDVVNDVKECSDYSNGVWSDGDITLAIGRVLCNRLGIEI